MNIDKIDHQIITATQAGLPFTPKPYQTIADELGINVEIVMQRMVAMQEKGLFGGSVPFLTIIV